MPFLILLKNPLKNILSLHILKVNDINDSMKLNFRMKNKILFLFFFVLIIYSFSLFIFHHHNDFAEHADCPICCFIFQFSSIDFPTSNDPLNNSLLFHEKTNFLIKDHFYKNEKYHAVFLRAPPELEI
jgi:hypothetical protein